MIRKMKIDLGWKITCIVLLNIVLISVWESTSGQSYAGWYNNAQQRIDTLRKGDFALKIFRENGQPFTGDVSVRMKKHEFPFGIAFDFYEGSVSMGNTYSTTASIQADADAEVYQTERWSDYLAYAIPVEKGKNYRLTLKFAEIFFDTGNARLFDVSVEGQQFLNAYDVYEEAGGKNKAKDTSITVLVNDDMLNIELTESLDNVSIKGIIVEDVESGNTIRINCGGPVLLTASGNMYVSEEGYFDPEANTIASREQWMQAAMYKYFNYGVSGNSFKWSGIQPQHTKPDYTNFDNAVRWTQKVGWELRAHTLLWGGNDAHSMPDWVRNLPNPLAIMDTCEMRIVREMTRYKGVIKEYDVINEPLTEHADWLRNTVGDSVLWNCFKWARSADPNAELFINDYNVEYNWGQAEEYRDLILRIKQMGGPVTGVGMQAHFWDCCRPNVDELVKNINIIAEAGLPIKLTEYDFGGNLTEAQQAEDLIKVLTIAFSHPSITGMISWVLRDSENENGWRPSSGYFNLDYTPKLAADTLLYYTKQKWATNFDSELSNGDSLKFNAYYGEYEIEVVFDDTVKLFAIPCLKEYEDSVFYLYEKDAELKGPQLISTELADDNVIKLTFDKAIKSNSLVRSNFKFFSNSAIGLNDVRIDPDNANVLQLVLGKNVPKGEYISVSYFPGNMEAADGSRASAFGPEAIYNRDINVNVALKSDHLLKVYPNPATTILNVQYNRAPFDVSVFNSVGMLVHNEKSYNELLTFDVSGLKSGLYLIAIRDSENSVSTKKVLVK